MADAQLLQYLFEQERQGVSRAQLRSTLLAQGYPAPVIDEAAHALDAGGKDAAISGLAQQYARQGYLAGQAFSTLLQQGYAPGSVRRAIDSAYGPGIGGSGHHAIIVVFLLIAALVAGGGIYLLSQGTGPQATVIAPNTTQSTGYVSFPALMAQVNGIANTQGKAAAVEACMTEFTDIERDKCLSSVATLASVDDDTVCDSVQDIQLHDNCLLYFVGTPKFEGVCARVMLVASKQKCDTIRSLQQTAKTGA